MAKPLDIIFAGSGEFGLPTLRTFTEANHNVVRVYTQPDRPAGRGKKLTPTPVAQVAEQLGLAVERTADLNSVPLPPADVMVVIAFGQKISEAAANHPRLGSINLHASLLPKYRGAAPINWAIINGEKVTGNSVIRLAQRMDSGAILGQSELEIGPMETAGEVHDRLANDGSVLVKRVLDELAGGRMVERSQDERAATSAPKLSRQLARLDWSESAEKIARQINGMYPWPGCRVRVVDVGSGLDVGAVTLARARALGGERGRPGEVIAGGAIAAGTGGVEVLEIVPEGKRKMFLADYGRGHRWGEGLRLEPIS